MDREDSVTRDPEALATGRTFDVFVAYNSSDKAIVAELASLFEKEGFSLFLDQRALIPGERWLDGLNRGLSQSRAFVACIGPSGLGPWMREEVDEALRRSVRDSSFPVIPVLLPGAGELETYDLPFARNRQCVDLRSGLAGDGLDRLYMAIRSAGARAIPEASARPRVGGRQEPAQDRFIEKAYSQEVTIELARIRQLPKPREEARNLVERVRQGDLQYASPSVKAQALLYSARQHAVSTETLDQARRLREELLQIDAGADTSILDALLLKTEGKKEDALRLLRDIQSPDAHTVFFSLLHEACDDDVSLEWYESQEAREDPDFFTGLGWYNLAVVLAHADRWEEAAARLASAAKHREEYADFSYIEGVVNAAMLLPAEFRHLSLETNLFPPRSLEGDDADRYRDHALACFARAEEALRATQPERSFAAREWSLRLRLTHADPEQRQCAMNEIERDLREPGKGVRLIPLADRFDIQFDRELYWQYLNLRAKTGGLEDKELHAQFVLAEAMLSPAAFIAFLDAGDARLRERIQPKHLVVARFEALRRDDKTEEARALLDRHKGELEDAEYTRANIALNAQEGKEYRAELERLYKETRSLEDLRNLVEHLGSHSEWAALRPLLRELFEQEGNLPNLRRLVGCMERDPGGTPQEALDLLVANYDLVERDPDLVSAKARAFFAVGRIAEARELNDELLKRRRHPADLDLDINLALQLGDWERFLGIVEREWQRRQELEPRELTRLASLAAETPVTSRAFTLLNLAVEKGSDDPHVLAHAAFLAYRLGGEEQGAGKWLARALELAPEDGPVRTMDLREMAEEWMPSHREYVRLTEDLWLKGEAPIHLAAHHLNLPLSMLLLDHPRRNAEMSDGRRRSVIPIMSGTRQPIPLQKGWTVGFDITTLMILESLGVLNESLGSFRRAVIPRDTMVVLLNERQRVRFHQPSLVARAEELRRLIDRGCLRVAESLPVPPADLAAEVGRDLAELLEAARQGQGVVVHPRPIHKLRSFLREEADLGEHGPLILSTLELERLLNERGMLESSVHERAEQYLRSQDLDRRTETVEPSILERPIYLDDLAVTYLQGAGLLPVLELSGLDLRIHPTLRTEQIALIEGNRDRRDLERSLEEIRIVLREALQSGVVEFLWRQDLADEDKEIEDFAPTLADFLEDAADCDAVAIDDRLSQRFGRLTDRQGKMIPVVGVFDILRHLETEGILSPEGRYSLLHRLRAGGFAMLPIESDELLRRLRAAPWSEDSGGSESVELRTIRQSLARLRSVEILQPLEINFLAQLQRASIDAVRQILTDEDISDERAIWMIDWLWKHVSPSPLIWLKDDQLSLSELRTAFVRHLILLLVPVPIDGSRLQVFLDWVEEEALSPLFPANVAVVAELVRLIGEQIETWAKDFAQKDGAVG